MLGFRIEKVLKGSLLLKRSFSSAKIKDVYTTMTRPTSIGTAQERQQYAEAFPEVVQAFMETVEHVPGLQSRCRTLLVENTYKEKQDFGFFVVSAYRLFEESGNLTPENVKLANLLGWCALLHFSSFLITDDIMDASEFRYGKQCWYRRNDVGMQAANDSVFMLGGINFILKKYFSQHHCYLPVTECFNNATLKFSIGQSLDMALEQTNMSAYTWQNHRTLAMYKGTQPSYILPTSLGLYLAGKYDQELHRHTETFLTEIGYFFISQNDILDCYGDVETTGKIGNDIGEGKCTWLIVKALEKASLVEKKILSEHYGKPNQESEALVRQIYQDLHILDEFRKYQEKSYQEACRIVRKIPEQFNKDFFEKVIKATYE